MLTYNAIGQIQMIDRGQLQQIFGYDPKGQLTSVSARGIHWDQRTFGYDLNGNRIQDSLTGSAQFLDDQIIATPQQMYAPDEEGQGRLVRALSRNQDEKFIYGVNGKLKSYQKNTSRGPRRNKCYNLNLGNLS